MAPQTLLLGMVVLLVLCFSFVLLFGAPFLPTLKPQIDTALELLDLAPGQTLLELGCGDGRVMLSAAKRGIRVVGYELNPILACIAWVRLRPYSKLATVICSDYWHTAWPTTDGIFAFILTRYMSKLDRKIELDIQRPVKLASFAFQIPGKKPIAEKAGVFLYTYD